MTSNTFRSIPHILAICGFLQSVSIASDQTPAVTQPEPSVSLKLDKSVLIENAKSLNIEQMENGGIRVSGTVVEEQTSDPGFYLTKTFSEPVTASALRFELSGVERTMGVSLTDEDGRSAFRHYSPEREDELDFLTIRYERRYERSNGEETFSGKLKKFSLFIPTPTFPGEFVIEISKIEIIP